MKVHILYTSSVAGILDEIIHFFTDLGDEVNILLPNQKTEIKEGDFLLLPDTGGINATTAAFYPTFDLPPDVPPQDQWFEYFRQNMFSYYKDKQKCKIIAIGTAACAIYGELGGKIDFDEDRNLVPVPSKLPNIDITVLGSRVDFRWSNKIWGTTRFKFDSVFYSQICEFLEKPTKPTKPPEAEAVSVL